MFGCCCAAKEEDPAGNIVQSVSTLSNRSVADEEVAIKAVSLPVLEEKAEKVIESTSTPNGREWFTASFDIDVPKSKSENLGIEVDPLDGKVMEVCKIREGLICEYNTSMLDQEAELRLGDFIVCINGVKGNTETMIERMQESRFKASVRRLKPWEVVLRQRPAAICASVTRAANGRTLLILNTDDQVMRDWNSEHPDLDIQKDDRILMINGIEGDAAKMIEQVEQSSDLKMLVGRPSPA